MEFDKCFELHCMNGHTYVVTGEDLGQAITHFRYAAEQMVEKQKKMSPEELKEAPEPPGRVVSARESSAKYWRGY